MHLFDNAAETKRIRGVKYECVEWWRYGDKANVSRAGARGQRAGDGESKRPGLVPRVEWCECEVYQMRCITWVVPMVASRQAGLISRLGAFPYSRWFGCSGVWVWGCGQAGASFQSWLCGGRRNILKDW